MVFCVVTGGALGFAVQKHWKCETPYWTMGGVLLGLAAGLWQTYRGVMRALPELTSEED